MSPSPGSLSAALHRRPPRAISVGSADAPYRILDAKTLPAFLGGPRGSTRSARRLARRVASAEVGRRQSQSCIHRPRTPGVGMPEASASLCARGGAGLADVARAGVFRECLFSQRRAPRGRIDSRDLPLRSGAALHRHGVPLAAHHPPARLDRGPIAILARRATSGSTWHGHVSSRRIWRGPFEHKLDEVARFARNQPLLRITVDLIFAEPYFAAARNRHTSPHLDACVRDAARRRRLESRRRGLRV